MMRNIHYVEHARFARQLKRRAQEMRTGRHDETHAMAMHIAGLHIQQLGRLLATAQARLEAIEAPRRAPKQAPYWRPAATLAALALGAASLAAIVGHLS